MRIIVIAILLAVPLVLLLSKKLLEDQGQRISLNVLVFVPGILLIVLLSLLTVGSQVLRAAFDYPVKSLRTE